MSSDISLNRVEKRRILTKQKGKNLLKHSRDYKQLSFVEIMSIHIIYGELKTIVNLLVLV